MITVYEILKEKRGRKTVWVIERVQEKSALNTSRTYIGEKHTKEAAVTTARLLAGFSGRVIIAKQRREI